MGLYSILLYYIQKYDPPPLNWSTPIVRNWRIKYENQATQTRRDCNETKAVEVLVGQGMARIDAIRQISITEQTYYRWRKQYGGMGTDQLKELRRLQKENERLRRAVSDLTLDKLILTEASRGN